MNPSPFPTCNDQTTALCYTRSASNLDTLKQHTAIETFCEQQGWLPEWYHDTDDRSAWLTLPTRLSDPDIAALVVYDLDRISRKFDACVALLDLLAHHHVRLALAGPGTAIYTASTIRAIIANRDGIEQWYATEIERRIKHSIALRSQRNP